MKLTILAIALALGSAAAAQDLPESPGATRHPGESAAFWTATIALSSSIVADEITTVRNMQSGCVEGGSPWLYGRQPGYGRFTLGVLLWDAPVELAAWRFRHSRHRLLRMGSLVLASYHAEEHWRGAIHNLGQSCR